MPLVYEVTSEFAATLAAASHYQTSETMNTTESGNDTADRRSGCWLGVVISRSAAAEASTGRIEMVNKEGHRSSPVLLGICIFSFLVFLFGRYIPTSSFDLVQHFLLVDEITKHATVRPESVQRIGAMALYPAAAHWAAAVIGWITGSGLIGIAVITIASAYLCYLFIAYLVGASTPANVLLFALAFLALRFTRSQIGWEVVANFFYPQLVADAVYFAVLLWVSNNRNDWKQAVTFLLAGAISMWIQPLVAVHVVAAGCVLMTFHSVERWKKENALPARNIVLLLIVVAASIAIVLTNAAFAVMRNIASNDGDLVLGYNHLMLVAVLCAAIGAFNLWKRLTGSAAYVDAVLGSAVIAAACLAILQFALLKLHGDGSAYAVKKHMFIVVTLGIVNAVRVITGYFPEQKEAAVGNSRTAPGGVRFILCLEGVQHARGSDSDRHGVRKSRCQLRIARFRSGQYGR